jgi:hypothetical protein
MGYNTRSQILQFLQKMHLTSWAIALLPLAQLPLTTAVPATEIVDDETFDNTTLPEFTPDGVEIVDMRHEHGLSKRADCTGVRGAANGECVRFFGLNGCGDNSYIGRYKPTCTGNCFVYDYFESVLVSGDGTYGVTCDIFQDTQCQNKVGSGSSTTGSGKCILTAGRSMKCYYRC